MNVLRIASVLVAVAACGGSVAVDPIGGAQRTEPDPGAQEPDAAAAGPVLYTGLVGTTDVSILYPLPAVGASTNFVQPSEAGAHGVLLPAGFVDAVVGPVGRLDGEIATYAELRLVSVRLDSCSARGGAGCKSEIRAVFQPLYDEPVSAGEPPAGIAARDGAIHVMYDVPDAELVATMKEILALKKANGNIATQELGPHPILAAQGLDGSFAVGLRTILLAHVGEARIARVTAFNHDNSEGDFWTFSIFDRTGATLVLGKIPLHEGGNQLVSGTSAVAALSDSSANMVTQQGLPDSVADLVSAGRPAAGSVGVGALEPTLESAVRIQNPSLHNAETTPCANCHLAEGARNIGESTYGFKSANPANGFTSSRSVAHKDERTSVTNLHAFGYLGRKVAIMTRTANESLVIADAMEAKVK